MGSLHIAQGQVSPGTHDPIMDGLRKEVAAACFAIILASSPVSAHANDNYVNAIISTDNRAIPTVLNLQNGENFFYSGDLSYRTNDTNILESSPKTEIAPETNTTPQTPELSQKSPLRSATVKGSMSVERFILDNFGTKDGWELLVDAGTTGGRGGDRVRKANRDLYQGHTYFLARSLEEADLISKIIREKSKNKIQKKVPIEEVSKAPIQAVEKKPKKSYTVTRPTLDEEANTFLMGISSKVKYLDKATMYQFRLPEEEMRNILKKIGLSDIHMPVINTLMFKLAKDESGLNYGAFGPLITHKSDHQGHRAIGLIQIMPLNWIAWSKKHFGTILEPTDINQEKVGFAQIAEYYKKYIERGYSLQKITEELAIAWYGSVEVKGLRSPSDYAKGFINSVFSDTSRVAEAKKILASVKKGLHMGNIQAKGKEKVPGNDTASLETVSENTQAQVVMHTDTIITKAPAVNDPLYFKSSPSIITGMNKVVSLNDYLKKVSLERPSEKQFRERLPQIGNTISTCQKELTNPANKTDLKLIIENQVALGNALTEAMELAHEVVPNPAFASGIEEAKTKMAKVLNFQTALEASLAKKAKQKAEEQRQARIAAMQLDSVRFAERALGLAA